MLAPQIREDLEKRLALYSATFEIKHPRGRGGRFREKPGGPSGGPSGSSEPDFGSGKTGPSTGILPGKWDTSMPADTSEMVRFYIGPKEAVFAPGAARMSKKVLAHAGEGGVNGTYFPESHPHNKFYGRNNIQLYTEGHPTQAEAKRAFEVFPEADVITGKWGAIRAPNRTALGNQPSDAPEDVDNPFAETLPASLKSRAHGFTLGLKQGDKTPRIGFYDRGDYDRRSRGDMHRAHKRMGLSDDATTAMGEFDPNFPTEVTVYLYDHHSLKPEIDDEMLAEISNNYPGVDTLRLTDYDGTTYRIHDKDAGTFNKPPSITAEDMKKALPLMDDIMDKGSQWTGVLKPKSSGANASGTKFWDCTIGIRKKLWDAPDGGYIALHELYHSYSEGHGTPESKTDYKKSPGWEEGPVEALTRATGKDIYPTMKPEMGAAYTNETAEIDRKRTHSYQPYVDVTEGLREKLGMDPVPFYSRLMDVPIGDRVKELLDMGRERLDLDEFFGETSGLPDPPTGQTMHDARGIRDLVGGLVDRDSFAYKLYHGDLTMRRGSDDVQFIGGESFEPYDEERELERRRKNQQKRDHHWEVQSRFAAWTKRYQAALDWDEGPKKTKRLLQAKMEMDRAAQEIKDLGGLR